MVLTRALNLTLRRVVCGPKPRMMSTGPEAILEEIGDAGVITLNRPRALNALTLNMVRLIYPRLKEWETTKSMVIIKGAGEKAFCAGGDVRSIVEGKMTGQEIGPDFFREEYRLNCLIGTLHIPYIALIDGITMGGGVGLSVHGTHRVATERTLFAMPETAIGLFPDVGGSYFLPRLGGHLGMYLALTGYRLKGVDVVKAGVATHMCDSARVGELEAALLALRTPYPEDITAVIDTFHKESSLGKDTAFSLQPVLKQIRQCFSAASVEDIIANLQKDGSEWAQKQLSTLARMSPTSLKVTFEQVQRGEHLTLQDCLTMETRMVTRFYQGHDFHEGVKALLIDKTQSPVWQPGSLAEVTQDAVTNYFAPLPPEEELVF